ncbi:Mannose-6-phosphate isomerase (EC 5.3.1.8) [uncultured Gammaproteobacteria bacterium]|nr:Mannose-6-phosphate isomerase (EC 5.3.1.8) [uncultured Gammaproteobacteria bacterium]
MPSKAWDAVDIANINGTTVRLHWANQPYKWHVNNGKKCLLF